MTMLVKLENYYRERGIYPAAGDDFGCKRLRDCRDLKFTPLSATKLSQVQNTFTPGHSAYVGAGYESAVPRVLFVALDLGTVLRNDDPDYNYVPPENRTPIGIRKSHERMLALIAAGKDKARRPTLKKSNLLAKDILQNLPGMPEEGGDFMQFCARVNAVKCTVNKEGRAQADNHLYTNCRECDYLRGEIEILSPNVIVSLGVQAKKAVEFAFSVSSEWTQERVVTLRDGKEAIWFPSYHPSSYGPYKKQENPRCEFVRRMRGRFEKK